ncbi:MAG: potassium transporter TrkA [Methanosarcinaceae archaeon]|nr:potassium transporter TrkA [Methanosarcinaceae archaeon]
MSTINAEPNKKQQASGSDTVKKIKPDYLIVGGGVVGFSVAKLLDKNNKQVSIADSDPVRVDTLRQAGFNAFAGDPSNADFYDIFDLRNTINIAVLTSDDEKNINIIEAIRSFNKDVLILSRAQDGLRKDDMYLAGANYAFILPKIISNTIADFMEKSESKYAGNRLAVFLEENRNIKLGIVVHDNPDPDAISSGFALKEIAKKFNIEGEILYDGKIGHHENKAFVNLLGLKLNKINGSEDYKKYDKLAMVDCSRPQVNNSVPVDSNIAIVIDHHEKGEDEIHAEFVDIRTNVGSTATIMTRYLQQFDVPISKELAAALLYGIRTDTNDFRRNTTSEDFSAASYLHPLSDHDLLTQVETSTLSVETLEILSEAIQNRQVVGSILLSNVGFIRDRDTLPQAADYLLKMEGISVTVIYGVVGDSISVSARNDDIRVQLGDVMRQAFGENAGGHSNSAGAKIPLGLFSDAKDKGTLLKLIEESVTKRFLNAIGVREGTE